MNILSRRAKVLAAAVALTVSSTVAIVFAVPAPKPETEKSPADKNFPANGSYQPQLGPVSNEGQQAIDRMKAADGFKIELVAAEPLLANPVAFGFDSRGSIYVAETYRQGSDRGVEDNRSHMNWLDDDLASQTVEDRVAFIKKHRGDKIGSYTEHHDRIRRLKDDDGDGKYDSATTFADGFNNIADGTGAGILAHQGELFYTCIPHLWKLRDTNGDGIADARESLSYGYGVKFAYRGHDMHGLILGPDGRLYFSIGDRGLNVTTKEGKRLVNTDSGAVLRCELDGSNLEIFCTGLRNPQELAFDDYGNLFTCDNNSDSGDKARWQYLVEGGDYGWRMSYQYFADRGPWNREQLWHPHHAGQAAYIVAPIANITDGPSGLTYYPGTGLSDAYRGHFFVCDFRGGASNSCIHNFAVEPNGATFKLGKTAKFVTGALVTDCDFGPDGGLYFSDWVDGWTGVGKGRIYKAFDPAKSNDAVTLEVKKLLAEGFEKRSIEESAKLLAHPDRRIRQASQFALAKQKATTTLQAVLKDSKSRLARLHAIWGLGQIARSLGNEGLFIIQELQSLTAEAISPDMEVRAQVTRVLGECAEASSMVRAMPSIDDSSPRVQHLAALALAKIDSGMGVDFLQIERLLEQSAANTTRDADPVLRHSAVMALAAHPQAARKLGNYHNHPSVEVRLGAVLALRRLAHVDLGKFLNDDSPRVVLEAARAIHDLPVDDAMSHLAAHFSFSGTSAERDAALRRKLNANFRLGQSAHAETVARLAGFRSQPLAPNKHLAPGEHTGGNNSNNSEISDALRIEALHMLGEWAAPSSRDRVLGSWRPIPRRDGKVAADALRGQLANVFSGSDKVRQEAAKVAGLLGIKEVVPALIEMLKDESRAVESRVAALRSIANLNGDGLDDAIQLALRDRQPLLRGEARRLLADRDPPAAVELLKQVLGATLKDSASTANSSIADATVSEQQSALATLAGIQDLRVDGILMDSWIALKAGRLPAEIRLDVVLAVRQLIANEKKFNHDKTFYALKLSFEDYEKTLAGGSPLTAFQYALAGGNAELGRAIFFEKVAVSCVRCHKIDDTGGEVGPNLSKIGADKTRQYLLEAIVDPNIQIAKGFETAVILLNDGRQLSGIVKSETGKELTLINADAQTVVLQKDQIDERSFGQSAMPADVVKLLTPAEVRDLVEYLATRK